ncbi:MAG: NADH-quinone oxidoreductase subunit L [Campylobacterota bacterium]|nr:NADH-quinone oxidoreductase subunit L [Campylobacterota bacterium]
MSDALVLNTLLFSPLLSATLIFLLVILQLHVKQSTYTFLALLGSGISAIIALHVSYESFMYAHIFSLKLFTWLHVDNFIIELSLKVDSLSAFMLLFVAPVSFLIHLYATGYMDKDRSYGRFFAYFNLFIFFMFLLVMSANPIVMFIGWEGVGLTSYALIGFYHEDIKNTYAGNKAFIVNRVGDFGFLSALMLLFVFVGDGGFSFDAIFSNLSLVDSSMLTLIAFLLFVGAMGKSAQIPLFVWLPDAMAGPTPVSALIHAATMVTAGVYMVARFAPLYNLSVDVSLFIAYIGAFSALAAAIIATRQFDIKKILAYSTMSQLGFMFMALGVGAYSTALFHTFTHAFFKALLFMGAGAIILALHHKQDIRQIRGVKNSMPLVFWMMFIASLTISAIPPLSAFFSKDAIMSSLFASGYFGVFAIAFIASLLTAFYMFRMIFVIFFSNEKQEAKKSSKSMLYPMATLTLLAIVSGFFNLPTIFGGNLEVSTWLNLADKHLHVEHNTEIALMVVNTLAILGVIFYTYKRYAYSDVINSESETSFVANKFYVDEFYEKVVVKPLHVVAEVLNKRVSYYLIDRSINILALYYAKVGRHFSYFENGNVRYYALYMLIGAVLGMLYMYMKLKAVL